MSNSSEHPGEHTHVDEHGNVYTHTHVDAAGHVHTHTHDPAHIKRIINRLSR